MSDQSRDPNRREFIEVVAIDPVENRLTVQRGRNGTELYSWDSDTKLCIFQPVPNVTKATKRFAAYRTSDDERYRAAGEFALQNGSISYAVPNNSVITFFAVP